jgi:hypothetical protein
MPATIEQVRALDLVGAFSCFTDGQITNALTKAGFYINEAAWDVGSPGRGACGLSLLAAHFIGSAPRTGNSTGAAPSGPVTAQSAGGISRSYGTVGGRVSESSFSSTTWGLQYLEMRRGVPTTPFVASC